MTKIFDIIHLNNEMYMVNPHKKDSDLIEGELIIDEYNQIGKHIDLTTIGLGYGNFRRILASTDNSLGLSLLPTIEEDIQPNIPDILDSDQVFPYKIGYKAGYKAAKAKKYTEEDMRAVAHNSYLFAGLQQTGESWIDWYNRHTKSLNPLPKQVEVSIQNCGTEDEGCIGTYSGVWENDTEFTMGYRLDLLNNIVQIKRWIYE